MKFKKIIDISLMIEEGMITYPQNPAVVIERVQGETSTRSLISFGTHTGTHVDAPRHSFEHGAGINKIPLVKFMGSCRVLDCTTSKECVTVGDLKKHVIKKGERILIKTTNSKRGFTTFYDDYVYLDGDAADFLATKGIALFGIDSLSVKERGGKDQRPHTALLKKGIVIFEGLDLAKTSGGAYTFIGLPLKFGDIDGAPARAVLIKN
jgi:arylformamidase